MKLPSKTVSLHLSGTASTGFTDFVAASILTALLIIAGGCGLTATEAPPQRQIGTVDLTIDFGGASENIDVQIPCSEDSTVMDIIGRAEMNGDIELQSSGSGETAFVESINGVGQHSSNGQYWTYRLNGELSKTGGGVTGVDPGDEVQWRFGSAPPELK